MKLITGRTGDVRIQLFRYMVAGMTAFLVDAGLLALLTECFGEDLLLLWTAIAFIAGLCVTYLFSIHWIFDSRRFNSRTAEMTIFALIGVTGLWLTELLMWFLAGKIGIHYLIAKVITTMLVFVWNFAAKKLILFRER